MLGKKHSKETRKRMSEAHKGIMCGEKNPMWKGGRVSQNQILRGSWQYKEWRIRIFTRDCFTCQICLQIGGRLNAHHIKSWAEHPNNRFDDDNGITLCEDCHKKTDNYLKKRYKIIN